jgi:hypothetical protein
MVTSVSKELPAPIVSLENRGSLLVRNAGTKLHCFTLQKHNFEFALLLHPVCRYVPILGLSVSYFIGLEAYKADPSGHAV